MGQHSVAPDTETTGGPLYTRWRLHLKLTRLSFLFDDNRFGPPDSERPPLERSQEGFCRWHLHDTGDCALVIFGPPAIHPQFAYDVQSKYSLQQYGRTTSSESHVQSDNVTVVYRFYTILNLPQEKNVECCEHKQNWSDICEDEHKYYISFW